MKKLLLLSLLFVCPWLVQGANVRTLSVEKKAEIRNELLQNPSFEESFEERYARLQSIEVKRITQADINGEQQGAKGLEQHGGLSDAQILHERRREALAWSMRIAFPAVVAFALGLANNWLARRAGCGVERWRFYRAPLREWLTGGATRMILLLWGEHLAKQLPNSFGHDQDTKRLVVSLYIMTLSGYLQELGEGIPLPGYPGWRSLPDPHISVGERFLALNLTLQCSHGLLAAGLAAGAGLGLYHGWRELLKGMRYFVAV